MDKAGAHDPFSIAVAETYFDAKLFRATQSSVVVGVVVLLVEAAHALVIVVDSLVDFVVYIRCAALLWCLAELPLMALVVEDLHHLHYGN